MGTKNRLSFGQVVNMLAFDSDNRNLNLPEAYSCSCKICVLKRTKINQKRPWLAKFLSQNSMCSIHYPDRCKSTRTKASFELKPESVSKTVFPKKL